jgi:hypothetical protein
MAEWGLDWLKVKAGGAAPVGDYIRELNTIKSEVEAYSE